MQGKFDEEVLEVGLNHLKQEYESNDHRKKQAIQYQEEQLKVLVQESRGSAIVYNDAKDSQSNGQHKLRYRHSLFFESLYQDRDLANVPMVDVQAVPQIGGQCFADWENVGNYWYSYSESNGDNDGRAREVVVREVFEHLVESEAKAGVDDCCDN